MRFDRERMKSIDIQEFLASKGYPMTREGMYYRLSTDRKIVIDKAKNVWYFNGSGDSRPHDILDWLTVMEGLSFSEAVKTIKHDLSNFSLVSALPMSNSVAQNFVAIETTPLNRRGWAYLIQSRGIPKEVIQELVDLGLLRSDPKTNNIIWQVLSLTDNQTVVAQNIRGTYSSKKFVSFNGSKEENPFVWRRSKPSVNPKALFIFEGCIDLMSFVALFDPKDCVLAAMSGLVGSHIEKLIKVYPTADLTVCVDSDLSGDAFLKSLTIPYREMRSPSHKDWNEHLQSVKECAE